MTRKAIQAALMVAVIAPVLGAQSPRRTPRPDTRTYSFSYSGNRARIGVLVNTVANTDTDRIGAKIDGVTPGGPAERAGLKAGDIITRFNGTSLAGVSSEDQDESGPGRRLIELVGDVDPGDTVRVEYRRGSESKTASIVTDEQGEGFGMGFGGGPSFNRIELPDAPMALMENNGFSFCFGDAWCELDLVTLSPELGEYFGTREGILVVKAPTDSALPLKGGDVILSIGGRKPASPAHAMRILRSYDVGETVSIEIMRHERRQTVSWIVPRPENRWKQFRTPRGHGEPGVWRVNPGVEGSTIRTIQQQVEAAQSLRDAVRSNVDNQLRQQELRTLLNRIRRSSTPI